MTKTDVRQRVSQRRRFAIRVGFSALLAGGAAACIFDKSDYHGGGRLDKGASATAASGSGSTAAPTGTPTDTATNPFLDAAFGGGD